MSKFPDIQTVECDSAAGLLAALDPTHPRWMGFEHGRWAFRGQVNSTWELIPRALRHGERLSFENSSIRAPLSSDQEQMQAELELLVRFSELANELGFALPGDPTHFRFPWKRTENHSAADAWPWTGVLEIAAIAQHHGVATRLLDFTLDPLVAAFFCATDSPRGAGTLAIWALDLTFVYLAWPVWGRGLRVVEVERAANPFLHAQSGLFVYDASGERTPFERRVLSHDLAEQTHLDRANLELAEASQRVLRFTLPVSEIQSLRSLLTARRVTKAHLCPTLDNIVGQLWGQSSP